MVNKVLTGKSNKKPRKKSAEKEVKVIKAPPLDFYEKKNGKKIMKKVMNDAEKIKEAAKEYDKVLDKIVKDLGLEHPKDYAEHVCELCNAKIDEGIEYCKKHPMQKSWFKRFIEFIWD